MFKAFKVLAALKSLRGTPFDIFGRTKERKAERAHRDEYIATLQHVINGLNIENHELAIDIAGLPLSVRGFGHVWERNRQIAKTRHRTLMDSFHAGADDRAAAE